MFKASWWQEKGYGKEYSKQIAKGSKIFAKELNLREEDIEGLKILLELREKLRPFSNLKEFLSDIFGTLMQRQGIILSEPAKRGFLRFYKDEEILEKELNDFGEALLKALRTDFDPLGVAINYILSESYKNGYTLTVVVDSKLFDEVMKEIKSEEEAELLGRKAQERVESLLKEVLKRKKEEKLRKKLKVQK